MNTKEIAQLILSTVESDVATIAGAQADFSKLLNALISKNVEPILAMADEKQCFDVITEILAEKFTDDEIKGMMDKYVPLLLKPFEGMAISAVRGIVTAFVIKTIDDNVLDKFAGADWFPKLQKLAADLKAGV